ncbi:MAG TPA: hypothetical protein VE344_07400 [Methylomirabilota bacterium]|nr:hypothetical protein [Methylomirabilota bacterium]
MNARFKKIILLLLAAALLFSSGQVQKSLNRDRKQLGLTISEPLQNAPPLLAFTTVALGGFRGLISNFLWIRSNDLQQDDKYFEAAQLADWITDLEPHFAQVWVFQAWNMAYNISVKFKDFPDRWRWVERGIELLRDNGLRYNPNDVLIHFQLAQFFQHKMGANLDDANVYYKQQWAREMTPFFGANGTNFENLISPQTPEEKTNALVLREKYKIDPVFAQKTDAQWGPLDWRLPEAHAIYWYALGLEKAGENPGKIKQGDLIQLRRGIYQTMQQAFFHGRLITDPFSKTYSLAPNLDLASKANDAYERQYADESDPGQKNGVLTGHRNFLGSAVYFLYENNRVAEAAKWYKILGEKYPDKPVLENDPNSFPKNLTLEDYAFARVQLEIGDTSQERTTGVIEGLIARSYYELAIGQDDRAVGFKLKARLVCDHYAAKIASPGNNQERTKLPPFDVLNRTVLTDLLDTQKPMLPYAARAVIRTQLGMPAETNAPPAVTISTNQIVPSALSNTNSPATNSIGK